MGLSTKASGRETCDTAREFRSGQMARGMKGNGRGIKLMGGGSFGTSMETCLTGSGKMTKQTGMGYTRTLMGQSMRVIGRTTSSMGTG